MELKNYQIQVIRDLERFLELLIEKQSISSAYSTLWNGKGVNVGIDGMPPYNSELAGVPGMLQSSNRWWKNIFGGKFN
jgi:type III restriction enzyme